MSNPAPTAAAEGNAEAQALAATRAMFQPEPPVEPVQPQTIDTQMPGVFLPIDPVAPLIPEQPQQQAAPVAEEVASEFEAVIPDDILALLAEPDLDEEETDEYVEPAQDELVTGEYEDPEVEALRKRVVAAEKKAAHYEGLRVKAAQKSWQEEAAKVFPLSTPETITATSRRSFLQAAKTQHDALKPKMDAALTREREALRANAAQQWGTPSQTGPQVPAEASPLALQATKAFNKGGFEEMIKNGIKSGNVRL